jgi:hypothetical protein
MNDAQNLAGVAASSSGLGKAFAASSAKYAAGGLLIGTVSAVSVFMAVTMPKTKGDFFASILSTVMASMCGGAYASVKFGLLADVLNAATEAEAILAMGGVIGISFICGLPAWAVVRAIFIWTEARKNNGIDELLRDAKNIVGK